MIDVVGIADDGWAGLDDGRRGLIERAGTVIGGQRHLDLVADHVAAGAEVVPWPSPLRAALPALIERVGDAVVVASGDPLRSGIGTTLVDLLGADHVRIHPAVGSDALARARQGWSAEETTVVTTVGRDLRAVLPHLASGARLVVLCSGGADPARLAALLTEHGWGTSLLTARWHLGGPDEGAMATPAQEFTSTTADLVVVCIEARADDPAGSSRTAGMAPGRPEDFIEHDGQLTKRDVRASALARLRPTPGAHLWDLGAGNGSVALEWCLAADRATATCVERDPGRAARITANAASLGLAGRVEVVVGDTTTADLAGLADADAVFVGGGLDVDLLDRAWTSLRPGGRLVAHAVTLEGESALITTHNRAGGELTRLSVEHAVTLGRFLSWTPARAVVQLATTKGTP
ncbi:precorrin-6y C5,15-methyltransferase (decarboxylating) subunit CbiE [Janibacter sp. Soil728]|uniref:precorrin-6y C5,15-methyltransferase (decarboxylating) subunit CbiE n=1 Tax=Janibacter sp. Soil728 TaxID=1736393 RepID=UPI001F2CB6E1|nr:precorrin-6y C5,15-methyltransferase (decarboxylating) subunit CbiE [Janibacter sp. Soil728]